MINSESIQNDQGSSGTLQRLAMSIDLIAQQHCMNFNGKGKPSLATSIGVIVSFVTISCPTAFIIYLMTFVLSRNGQTFTA